MKKLKVLSKVLSSLGLKSHSNLVIKIAGETEVKYLESLNWAIWLKERGTEWSPSPAPDRKKDFWSGLKSEFDSREGGGPIFDEDTLELIKTFDTKRLPKRNGKLFTKWLGRWIRDWNEIALSDQNTILDWWSVTGGTEEGKSFDEKMIEILSPAYALQRAEEYHNDEGFYFDPTEKYLTPPDKYVIHDFGDGFKIVYVPAFREMEPYPFTEEELKENPSNKTSHDRIVEGNRMGVCLGKKMRLYQTNSSGKIYSLRNSNNDPCVTIRAETDYNDNQVDYEDPDYDPFDNSKTLFRVFEFQGLGNSVPSKKYADYILRFFKRVPGHDEVDIDDQTTLILTKMNSKDRGERLSAMRLAKGNSLVGNKVLSTDWKTLKEDDPDLFKRIIINTLFNSKEDFLDFSKLGGDEEKKKLIIGSWRDFASSKEINLAKEVSFSTGKEFLIELVPELLTHSSLTAILFPADYKTREKELRENPRLRSFVWNNRIKLEPVTNLKLYDAKRIIEFFKDEIINDGGIGDTVKMIVKLLLEQKEYGGDTAKKLVEIQTVITPVVNSTLGINIQLINLRRSSSCGKLSDDVFQSIKEKKLELLYGISPFSIPMEVMKTGMSLEKNDYLNLFSHSKKEVCGNTRELYDLTEFIAGPVLRMRPLDIFDQEFWGRCLIQNLNAAQEDETTFSIWIITAAASVPRAVKNAFSKILRENRRLLAIAIDTYFLGVFFSKEELIEILGHHGIDGKKADHQYY